MPAKTAKRQGPGRPRLGEEQRRSRKSILKANRVASAKRLKAKEDAAYRDGWNDKESVVAHSIEVRQNAVDEACKKFQNQYEAKWKRDLEIDFLKKRGQLVTKEEKFFCMRACTMMLKHGTVTSRRDMREKVGHACGLSHNTVESIFEEYWQIRSVNNTSQEDRPKLKWGGFVDNVELFQKSGPRGIYDRSQFETIKREHLLAAHVENVKRYTERQETSTYAELLEYVARQFPGFSVSYKSWRLRLIREFNYEHQDVKKDTGGLDMKSLYQKRCFLIQYADALKNQTSEKCSICYMDETWCWRYWAWNTGVAPKGELKLKRGTRKGQRMIIVHALDSEGEMRTDDSNAPSSLLTWVYTKDKGSGDYHDAMNGERFKAWVNDYFIPSYQYLHGDWETGDPCVLVLDNAPYHVFGMVSPYTNNKQENLEIMRNLKLKQFTVYRDARDGGEMTFKVPLQGEFERAPKGPSKSEVAEATYKLMKSKDDPRLKSWIERRFEELGWQVIFTPPNTPAWQPIELFWACGKNWVARNFRKGRTFEQIVDLLKEAWDHQPYKKRVDGRNEGCDVKGMIKTCQNNMDYFIAHDAVLNGNIFNLQVDNDVRHDILAHDPKYMTPEEMAHIMGDESCNIDIPVPMDPEEFSDIHCEEPNSE